MAHVAQWQQHGLLFPIRYLMASRNAAGSGGDRYRDNPFEVEARKAEADVRARVGPAPG